VNGIERVVRAADRAQQGNRGAGFVVGVVKKFGDDRGPALSAQLTYYAFMSLFPLLLALTTILGFVGNATLEHTVIGTTLRQFPVVGDQIGKNVAHPLRGSGVGLAVGIVVLLYGAMGVAQSAQHAMAQVWNVPGVIRPGFVPRLVRGLTLFATLGVGMACTGAVSSVATAAGQPLLVRLISLVVGAALNVGLFIVGFRILTPRSIGMRELVVGAAVGGVGYTVLLAIGTALVQHQLRHAEAVYGQFGFVLGLIGWLFLVAQLSLYAAECNVVRQRRLWPRSIVQPPLTEPDMRVLHDIARQEERRPEERVGVGFEPDPADQARADAETDRHRTSNDPTRVRS